jgi:hypothetical protein
VGVNDANELASAERDLRIDTLANKTNPKTASTYGPHVARVQTASTTA